ncbi:MAG: Lrp/AsnC family transcriptional regulator [Actinomycetales bacterium]|nr:MAG: Lrp/AsnC family transcriptional regulator [Actinomycetales bacterium]
MPPKDVQALDDVDRRLVVLLQRDGRMPNNELARRAGIAPSTCLNRVRGLQERGVIRGVHADVDLGALGLTIEAMIAVVLRREARASIPRFAGIMQEKPYVINAFYVSGSYDYLLHVACDGTDGLREVVNDLSVMPQVAGTETHLIFEHRPGRAVGE